MTYISNGYPYSGYNYEPKSREDAEIGYILATVASAVILKTLPSFSNPFLKQMSQEHANNHLYKDAFFKSIENSGLKEKGLTFNHVADVATNKGSFLADIGAGLNACYIPDQRKVLLNADKATISGFHELGHAMNHLKSKTGRFLQKFRKPGYVIAGLMGSVALFSRTKPKEADRNIWDWLQDNCGKIAFISMLPTVAEEALASYKGVKLAKEAGLSPKLLNNLKKFYGKALLSYLGYALVTGISVFAASKITEKFTRPKVVENRFNY